MLPATAMRPAAPTTVRPGAASGVQAAAEMRRTASTEVGAARSRRGEMWGSNVRRGHPRPNEPCTAKPRAAEP